MCNPVDNSFFILRSFSKVPLVVRLAGTNFEKGKDILEKSDLKILSASDLNDAAKKIVEAIK